MAIDFSIPTELIEGLQERRVIPFLGAGFSGGLGFPNWEELLRAIADELAGDLKYDQISEFCRGDPLQIAEYFFLQYDRSIGPVRHGIEKLLKTDLDLSRSTAHVELVNLNAPQIYTTNYDEAIEGAHAKLRQPHAVVALPKHVATTERTKTQIVKYHGDLRYDSTLVLTESSYYSRLDFESPMDLKFRSDLLGRSVLFVGYSFRDINIRVIWFKLMEMMKDVPDADRPSSFIVRFEKNPVLEELYRSVGIKTIYLDPTGSATSNEAKQRLLDKFMTTLASRVSRDSVMPGCNQPMFASLGLIDGIREAVHDVVQKESPRRWPGGAIRDAEVGIQIAEARIVPPSLWPDVDELLHILGRSRFAGLAAGWALKHLRTVHASNGPAEGAAFCLIRAIPIVGAREKILAGGPPWNAIWARTISTSDAELLIKVLRSEIAVHEEERFDDDIAYAAELVKRIELGQLVAGVTGDPRCFPN